MADLEEDKEFLKTSLFEAKGDLEKKAYKVSLGSDELYNKFVNGKFVACNDKGREIQEKAH